MQEFETQKSTVPTETATDVTEISASVSKTAYDDNMDGTEISSSYDRRTQVLRLLLLVNILLLACTFSAVAVKRLM